MTNHEYLIRKAVERLRLLKELINQFDKASEDRTKLEIAGNIISLVQKVIL